MEPSTLEKVRALAHLKQSDIGQSEENVKQKFLVPLLEVLGHDKNHLDFERTTPAGRPDVIIERVRNDCKVIVDTKSYGENLDRHLVQIGSYAVQAGALITVITNGEEVRLYSPLRGVSFERSLLFAINRENLERELPVIEKLLSRTNLTDGRVHDYIEVREKELRSAYAALDELAEKYSGLSEEINSDVATLEGKQDDIGSQIDAKRQELSRLENKQREETANIWKSLGLVPKVESRQSVQPLPGAFSAKGTGDGIDREEWEALILEALTALGRRAYVKDILTRIDNKLAGAGKLTPYMTAFDGNQIRWKHMVHSTRVQLVKSKKLRQSSARGFWELP